MRWGDGLLFSRAAVHGRSLYAARMADGLRSAKPTIPVLQTVPVLG